MFDKLTIDYVAIHVLFEFKRNFYAIQLKIKNYDGINLQQ